LLCHLFFLRNDQDSNVQYFWFTLPTIISIFEFLYVFLILYLRKHGNGKFLRGFPGSPCLMTGYPKLAASKQTIIKIWVCTSVCVCIYIYIYRYDIQIYIYIYIFHTHIHMLRHVSFTLCELVYPDLWCLFRCFHVLKAKHKSISAPGPLKGSGCYP
jgi:hypothetical protein